MNNSKGSESDRFEDRIEDILPAGCYSEQSSQTRKDVIREIIALHDQYQAKAVEAAYREGQDSMMPITPRSTIEDLNKQGLFTKKEYDEIIEVYDKRKKAFSETQV